MIYIDDRKIQVIGKQVDLLSHELVIYPREKLSTAKIKRKLHNSCLETTDYSTFCVVATYASFRFLASFLVKASSCKAFSKNHVASPVQKLIMMETFHSFATIVCSHFLLIFA